MALVLKKVLWKSDFLFPGTIWLLSRLFLLSIMLLVTPNLPTPARGVAPTFGLGVFDAYDSLRYYAIATSGYEFLNDGQEHNIAFFPLFPLIIKGLMSLGLPFEVAGVLLNNIAFLVGLYYLYFWIQQYQGKEAARWVTAIVTWCPLSMYCTVIYTEGLYLLLSIAALRAFDHKQYTQTVIWGALATATRPTGLALIPALLLASWKERRPPIAYVASLFTGMGVLLFTLYCKVQFNNPLAFIDAQKGWRPSFGFDGQGWGKMLVQITIGTSNWRHGIFRDPLHILLFGFILGCGYLLWCCRKQLSSAKVDYGFGALILLWWILGGDPLIDVVSLIGGGYLLWRLRSELTPVTVFYGFCGIGLLLASGGTWSLSRLVYGIISPSIALGVLVSRHPRWGYMILGFSALLLATFSVRFAQKLWVG